MSGAKRIAKPKPNNRLTSGPMGFSPRVDTSGQNVVIAVNQHGEHRGELVIGPKEIEALAGTFLMLRRRLADWPGGALGIVADNAGYQILHG